MKMDLAIQVQILEKAACSSHSINILGNGMHPTLLFAAIIVGQTNLFNLYMATSLEGNL